MGKPFSSVIGFRYDADRHRRACPAAELLAAVVGAASWPDRATRRWSSQMAAAAVATFSE